MNFEAASSLFERFKQCRVLVVGDLMLDNYLWGHIERISPEAPVPILNLVRRERTLGGAGNAVKNLVSLGGGVSVLGVLGVDATGTAIVEELDRWKADRTGVVREADRKSSRKIRLMSIEHGQQVFRYDEETTRAIEPETEDALLGHFSGQIGGVQAVLCSDYKKGVLTRGLLQGVFLRAREHGVPVVVAPKAADAGRYRGASVLVPNVTELAQLSRTAVDGTEWLDHASAELIRELELESLLVTRGGEGMALFESARGEIRRLDIPAVARSVYDVTGAGDTVASAFTLALAAGADHESAARLANLAAGIVVGKRGTACVSPEDLLPRMKEEEAGDPALVAAKRS